MRVRCTNLISATTDQPLSESPWLTVGRTYLVLSLVASPGRGVLFRLVGDEGRQPGLFAAGQFEGVDQRLSTSWIVRLGADGLLELGPQAWLRSGFWEDYFDRKVEAITAFDNGRARMMLEAEGQ